MSNLLEQASLVMIPSGYKEDVVYSEIPLDGSGDLQFTRSSDATRINSAGLVEDVPWNLVTYSEEFTNVAWAKGFSSITANATIAPNGTTTADKLVENNTTNQHFAQQVVTVYSSTIYTITVYAKASERSRVNLLIAQSTSPFTNFANITYDLLAGTVSDTTFGTGSITSVGNGWFRCVATGTATASTGVIARVSLALTNNSDNYLGDGTSGAFIWGAQLNIGSTAKPYFPTTDRLNVPRLTYQNGGGGCPSLLLEPQRTNLLTWSDDFSNAAWSKDRIVVTANATTSPDGTQNADKIADTLNGNNTYRIFNSTTLSAISYTQTFYAKAAEYNWCYVRIGNASRAWFNVGTGVVGTVDSGLTASIQSVGDGWYRIITTITTATAGSGFGLIALTTGNGVESYTPTTGGMGIYVYGAQLEAGSYATSIINTTSSSATRVADACFKTGISSLIGQTEGAFMIDVNLDVRQSFTYFAIAPNIGSASTYIGIGFSPTTITYEVVNSGVQAQIFFGNSATGRFKIAAAYKANDFVLYVNGTQIGTDTSGTVPTCSEIGLFQYNQNQPMKYNEVLLFPTRLTNAELAQLTA